MTKKKQTESSHKDESKTSNINFPFGNFEEMFKMMQKSCDGGKGSFGCCAMMQQMCGGTTKEPEEKS